jgi:hypothetical protein
MTSTHPHFDYLEDILDAIEKATEFIQGMTYEQFAQDAKTVFAVIHALEIVGEATKQIPQSVKKQLSRSTLATNGRDARQVDSRLFWCELGGSLENGR